tara:strand:- start:1880 stop:2056 length:177 start_codon:yes stop_codon:yes gene_type:complete
MITIPMYTFITIVVLAFIITLIMVYFAGKHRESEILYANALDRLEELGEDMSDWKEGY